jgi:saccharopine dehydrogenase-like NADP-dependent oxidoreductase
VEQLGWVKSVRIRVGTVDFNPSSGAFCFPYSAQTIVEELTRTPWVFERGQFREVKPRTAWEQIKFPAPVGSQWLVRTRHSEVATIPLSFRKHGLRECDFKVGFDKAFVQEVIKRLRAGETVRDFAKLPASRSRPNDYEITRVVATGKGKRLTLDCHAKANRRWRASAGDIDTACPLSIVAQMVATGIMTRRGVVPPENAVPVDLFFAELRKRGMKIVRNEESL